MKHLLFLRNYFLPVVYIDFFQQQMTKTFPKIPVFLRHSLIHTASSGLTSLQDQQIENMKMLHKSTAIILIDFWNSFFEPSSGSLLDSLSSNWKSINTTENTIASKRIPSGSKTSGALRHSESFLWRLRWILHQLEICLPIHPPGKNLPADAASRSSLVSSGVHDEIPAGQVEALWCTQFRQLLFLIRTSVLRTSDKSLSTKVLSKAIWNQQNLVPNRDKNGPKLMPVPKYLERTTGINNFWNIIYTTGASFNFRFGPKIWNKTTFWTTSEVALRVREVFRIPSRSGWTIQRKYKVFTIWHG